MRNAPTDIYNRLSRSYSEQSLLQLWYRFLACHVYCTRSISRQLKASCGTSLPGYDVMSVLAHYPAGINMTQLARLLMVRNSNVTGIVNRLEEAGLIVKTVTSADKRNRLVKLTRKGRGSWQRMNRAYEGFVEQLLGTIGPAERDAIGGKLQLIQNSVLQAKLPVGD